MDEHNTKCDIEMGRNREKVKHISPPTPKEKQGASPMESPILLRRETSYGLGVPQQIVLTREINISQYARTIRKYNTKGYRIIPYSRQLK